MKISIKKINYVQMLLMQLVVIVGVVVLFRVIPDRKIASIFTTLLFILLSAIIFYVESTKIEKWKNPLFICSGIFLFLIVIPLAVVRFLNWQYDFSELKIWWIAAPKFHNISNYIFILMIIASLWNLFKSRKN
jgi:hypothetical protein